MNVDSLFVTQRMDLSLPDRNLISFRFLFLYVKISSLVFIQILAQLIKLDNSLSEAF